MIKSIVILLCKIILAHALGCSQNSSLMTVDASVQLPNQVPFQSVQAVIPTLQFECQALITGGSIRAIGDLNIDLQIWRPHESTGTFYNLVWKREFRRRSSLSKNTQITSSFSMFPGIPVRPGDVIGFHSFVVPRLLFDVSQPQEVFFIEAEQGPLCNFSINGAGVMRREFPLPSISLTYINATNEDILDAEQRLPLIGDTCTVLSLVVDTTVTTVSTQSISSNGSGGDRVGDRGGDSSQGQGKITSATPSASSELVNGANATEGEAGDGFFLTLSLTEFILVIVVLAVVLISICVVITIALCCCLYVQRMTTCRGKDENQISMNSNPVYDSIRTPRVQSQFAGSQLPCAGGQQPTLVALVPPCTQAPLQANCQKLSEQASSGRLTASSERLTASSLDSYADNSLQSRHISVEDNNYSYPKLTLLHQERHNSRTSDGYIIVQPDHFVQGGSRENIHADVENHGPRGLMDHTL